MTPLISVIGDWWTETSRLEHAWTSPGRVIRCPATWTMSLGHAPSVRLPVVEDLCRPDRLHGLSGRERNLVAV